MKKVFSFLGKHPFLLIFLFAALVLGSMVLWMEWSLLPATRIEVHREIKAYETNSMLAMTGYHLGDVTVPITQGAESQIYLVPDDSAKPTYKLVGTDNLTIRGTIEQVLDHGVKDVGTWDMDYVPDTSPRIDHGTIHFSDGTSRDFYLIQRP